MPPSSAVRGKAPEQLVERLLELLWSLWAEAGVPGWSRRHETWAIDPEPLILVTAFIGESDPRLRDEAIRWCVRNSRYISAIRLRNLLNESPAPLEQRWGPVAATVNAHSESTWPGATTPLPTRLTSEEAQDDFTRPALLSLRLRTTFGVGARAEILQYFIAHPDARASASDLAEVTHYSKRNVEKELESLRKAGMLDAERRANRLEHYVLQPDSLRLFASPRPQYFPRWDAIFAALVLVCDFQERLTRLATRVAAVEARRLHELLAPYVRQATLPPLPALVPGHSVLNPLLEWIDSTADALARADAAALGWSLPEPAPPPRFGNGRADGARTVASPLLATATDLVVWSDTRVAQERMPELLRRLILATTPGVQRITMAAGDAIHHAGFDGLVESITATPFVPEGLSVWETGVGSDVRAKATSDYEKRSKAPGDINPSAATFVFVTPRRWPTKRAWEVDRKKEQRWRDVRVLDADDLETWLASARAVHAWLSSLMGKSWGSVQDLRSFWTDWCEATSPSLSADLVLAGRDKVAEQLREQLRESFTIIRVQGDSADESLAFIAAVVEGLTEAELLFSRSLVVSDLEGWNWAAESQDSLLLIPRFGDPSTARAIRHGHRVVVPVGREDAAQNDLALPRVRRELAKAALLKMGVSEREADDLATLARASMTALRRRLAVDKGLARPPWTHRVEAPALLPALLAGAWDGSKVGDQAVISALADRPYQDVERSLAQWARTSDPPVRKVGANWFLLSKEDAWYLLSGYLTQTDIDRFRDALLRALGVPDPALDLEPERRWMANVIGFERPLSDFLRDGLVDTLAIMGSRGSHEAFLSSRTGAWHAHVITRQLLDRANVDDTYKLWASLSDSLPLLAEAAPEVFLEAVEFALHREPSLAALFTDSDSSSVLFATSPHTGLLWALENLAWSPEYLHAATAQLATLAHIDPGSRNGNRPIGSLRSIFLPWYPQTTASLPERLSALDSIRKQHADVAWDLMLSVLPTNHSIAMPNHAPRWRDWKDTWTERVPHDEYVQSVDEVVNRLLSDVGLSGKRWSDLITHLNTLPWTKILEMLEAILPDTLADGDRLTIWEALRTEISRHRRHSKADWALPSEVVDRLEHVYHRLTPADPVHRVAWLFSQVPNLLEGERSDWRKHQAAVQRERASAIRELREQVGLEALKNLTRAAEQPRLVGYTVGSDPASRSKDDTFFLDLLNAPSESDRWLAHGYVGERFRRLGWSWATPFLEENAPSWPAGASAAFLSALDFGPETWNWAETLGEEVARLYWASVQPHLPDEDQAISRAAECLSRHDRADAAIDLLGMALHRDGRRLDETLLVSVLERLLDQAKARDVGGLADDVAAIFAYLDRSATVDPTRIARLEFAYLPLLERTERRAKILHGELARNPSFFVEVLSLAFRAEGEEPRSLTEGEKSRASRSFELLESWNLPPGFAGVDKPDKAVLTSWVETARALAAEHGRRKVADTQIGRILTHAPPGDDGIWPHPFVRDLVEHFSSRELETGLEVGRFNSRGVTTRSPTDGGAQERELQTRYLVDAQQVAGRWPRTAAMLRRIARSFADMARRHDQEAEITEDRWR